ncbi:hypothetical protein KII91_00675 [Leuconostoc gelidum subsp. gelidum]|uniref:hypothetical protein n=1 Tax=Leuconostoc gelidum TaxID=1244 RepID=UPI001CC45470|nr:hypothetical protein [Leuconostoc gelidum]MBZ5977856.1 hypothetical protein [Leuconostoc gelidum subsp. gelidum]MBZ6001226.1 hypothetical protein [Leuconostoc gelidum subsp. gelidum]
MKKLKENKMWITVVVIGLIVIAILLAMLHQQKQNSPEGQASSYSSSAKTSSAVESNQDEADAKAYAKKAAHMKGHVLDMGAKDMYYTSWSKQDLINWAKEYNSLSDSEKHKASTNFGTSTSISNNSLNIQNLNNASESILKGDFKTFGYYDSVKEFNAQRQNSNFNPDNIQK